MRKLVEIPQFEGLTTWLGIRGGQSIPIMPFGYHQNSARNTYNHSQVQYTIANYWWLSLHQRVGEFAGRIVRWILVSAVNTNFRPLSEAMNRVLNRTWLVRNK